MKRETLTLTGNRPLNSSVFELTFTGASPMSAGQFVELTTEGFFLRRPISVADWEDGKLTLLVRIAGEGTKRMSALCAGDKVDALTCLGNGFDLSSQKPLLIGGGIGCAPLYKLAKDFVAKGVRPEIVLGFRNADEAYYVEEFSALGNVTVATDDGSAGVKGNAVAAALGAGKDFDLYYACGPAVMLRALCAADARGQVSLEARMGCGFGACMGCSIKTTGGFRRVCKEGPVFRASEVIWE